MKGSAVAVCLTLLVPSLGSAQTLWDLLRNSASQSGSSARNSMEVVYVLSEDGLTVTEFNGTRTPDHLQFLVEVGSKPADMLYFFPPGVQSKRYDAQNDAWQIPPGGYSSMDSRSYDSGGNPPYLKRNPDGSYTYTNWDGKTYQNGGKNFGSWITGGFADFSLAWVVPRNIEILRYSSNADSRGRWRSNLPVLSYQGRQVNNFTFKLTYRVRRSEVFEAKTLP